MLLNPEYIVSMNGLQADESAVAETREGLPTTLRFYNLLDISDSQPVEYLKSLGEDDSPKREDVEPRRSRSEAADVCLIGNRCATFQW